MNLYGWSKHLFDLAGRRAHRAARKDAAAMGRAEILQRVRPERVSQGRDDERAGEAVRRHPRPARPCSCSSRIGTASPTAISGATSSMSTTWCAVVAGYWPSRSVNGIFNVGTGKARSFRELIVAAVRRAGHASRTSNMSTCRGRSATAISISREAEVDRLQARRLQWRLHVAGRWRRRLCQGVLSISPTAIADRATETEVQCSISTRFRAPWSARPSCASAI